MNQDDRHKNDPAHRRVLLGLSGGVDSTASASLLKAEGFEVTAVTLRTWQEDEDESRLEGAARSARLLGLPHLILDVRQAFLEEVVEPFVQGWRQGLTPNPCVFCNPDFKFQKMIHLADELGCHYIASGHYARVGWEDSGRWLYRASHRRQDQSYFLYRLPSWLLERLRFPLGGMSKEEARQIAGQGGDPVASARDSQDICFIPKGRLKDFLINQGLETKEGAFIDRQGQVIGRHSGAWQFTLGQRRHLGQAWGRRMTVLAIDANRNTVMVGDEAEAMMTEMSLVNCLLTNPLPSSMEVQVQLRSQGIPHPACLTFDPDQAEARVRFPEPVRMSSPGQSAVFYQGDRVLGGGLLDEMV